MVRPTSGLLFAGLLAASCCARADDVASPPLQVSIADSGATLVASGRWITKVRRGNNFPLSTVNSVQLTCVRDSMTCIESRAELSTAAEAKATPHTLGVRSIPFRVTEWSEARIIARTDTPSSDLMLKVDLAARQVELSYWDTQPGVKPGTAEGFTWMLR